MSNASFQRREYNGWRDYELTLAQDGWYVPGWTGGEIAGRLFGGERVLDVGCGTGLLSAALTAAGWSGTLVGADLAEQRMAEAMAKGRYRAVVQANAAALPFRDASWDAVISCGMVGLTGPRSVWEMARLVRPGGMLAVAIVRVAKRAEYIRRYNAALRHLRRMPGMQVALDDDLGSGYVPDYAGERYRLLVLRKD